MKQAIQKIVCIFLLILFVLCTSWNSEISAYSQYTTKSTELGSDIQVPGGEKKISLHLSSANVRDVLRDLANQGKFNLVLDESVGGSISVELDQVTINKALRAISTLSGTEILKKSSNIYLAISKETAEERGLDRHLSKVIKIRHGNANRIASILTASLFMDEDNAQNANNAIGGGQQQGFQNVRADSRTNSLIVVGTGKQITLAENAVKQLDRPRESKTFYLSHANALDVATSLASGIFNDGTSALTTNSGGAGGGGAAAGGANGQQQIIGGLPTTPSSLRVEQEDVEEGEGINELGGDSENSSGPLSSSIVLRGTVKSSQIIQVNPQGPLVIPDSRTNSVTVMGTVEQIALAESMIPILDAQLPQVIIEASLVEISETGAKDLGNSIGIDDGKLRFGFNNQALAGQQAQVGLNATIQPAGTGLVGIPTIDPTDNNAFARSGIGYSTNPLNANNDYVTQIRALINNRKAKILANPSVVATHDSETVISIVDEIVRTVTVTVDGLAGTTQIQNELGEAGIVLDILPKVGADNTITMRVRPSITSVRATVQDSNGNTITLLNKRDILAQRVRMQDGETLVIGGLINETDINRNDKLPGIGDLPIVGAMFRAVQRTTGRTELVLLLTPHILNNTKMTPVNYSQPIVSRATGGLK